MAITHCLCWATASLAVLAATLPSGASTAEIEPAKSLESRLAKWRCEAKSAAAAGRQDDAQRLWARVARAGDDPVDARAALAELATDPPTLESRPLASARAALPEGFRERRTRSFVILSDAPKARVELVARSLEHVRSQFEAHVRRLDLPASPIRHRLVCIVFAKRADFLEFARSKDRIGVEWCHGYYAPRHDRVVVYDAASERGADEFAEARCTAALVHETVHQLSMHRLVQDATVQYPIWLSEGLATSFETDDTSRPFGPHSQFDPRERRLRTIVSEGRLISLREFVGVTRVDGSNPDQIAAIYGQSYGFYTWLIRTRPDGVRAFFAEMHALPPGRVSREVLTDLFESTVGPLTAIERRWLLHLDGLASRDREPTHVASVASSLTALRDPQESAAEVVALPVRRPEETR